MPGDPDYATAPARIARRQEVDALLGAWVGQRSVDQAVEALSSAGVPVAPIRTYADAAADPHVDARDMLQTVAQPGGDEAPITGPAAKLSRTPIGVRRGAPALGGDTEEILDELGVSSERRSALRASRVV